MRSEGPGGRKGRAVEKVLDIGIRGDRGVSPEVFARRQGEPALQHLLLDDLACHVLDEQHAGVLVLRLRRAAPAVREQQAGFFDRELRELDAAVRHGRIGVVHVRDQPAAFDDHGGLLLAECVAGPGRAQLIGEVRALVLQLERAVEGERILRLLIVEDGLVLVTRQHLAAVAEEERVEARRVGRQAEALDRSLRQRLRRRLDVVPRCGRLQAGCREHRLVVEEHEVAEVLG